MSAPVLRIGTRKSPLALWQAEHVQGRLAQLHPGLVVELVPIVTEGDRVLDRRLAPIGGKGLFLKEIEEALIDGRADIAVHSLKDVTVTLPPGLILAAMLEREDPRDAFVSNRYSGLDDLPPDARLGTASLRRQAMLRTRFPNAPIEALRGNVNTRLKRLDDGDFDAILLAAAGLKRLGFSQRIRAFLSVEESLPAVGQGVVCIECREGDESLRRLVQPLEHAATRRTVSAERQMNARLQGGCQVPLAGHAVVEADGSLLLRGLVAEIDGSRVLRAEARGNDPIAIGTAVAEMLLAQGARDILARCQHAG